MLALVVAAGDTLRRGFSEGDDYLGDGRWGYGAFVFAPFIVLVCGFVAVQALREWTTKTPGQPPPRWFWGVLVLAYAAFGVALLVS